MPNRRGVRAARGRLRGWTFRFYHHRPRAVIAAAEAAGLRLSERRTGLIWQMLVLTREAVAT